MSNFKSSSNNKFKTTINCPVVFPKPSGSEFLEQYRNRKNNGNFLQKIRIGFGKETKFFGLSDQRSISGIVCVKMDKSGSFFRMVFSLDCNLSVFDPKSYKLLIPILDKFADEMPHEIYRSGKIIALECCDEKMTCIIKYKKSSSDPTNIISLSAENDKSTNTISEVSTRIIFSDLEEFYKRDQMSYCDIKIFEHHYIEKLMMYIAKEEMDLLKIFKVSDRSLVALVRTSDSGRFKGDKVVVRLGESKKEESVINEKKMFEHLGNGSDNLVKMLGYDTVMGYPVTIIEYIEGCCLSDFIENINDIYMFINIARQIILGVHYMKTKGILHDDIKPDNIMCRKNLNVSGGVVIADFEFGRLLIDPMTGESCDTEETGGTYRFKSPERLGGFGLIDFSSDVWSLGVTLFVLLTGKYPIFKKSDDNKSLIHDSIMKLSPSNFPKDAEKYVAEQITEDINSMLIIDPKKRKTTDELLKGIFFRDECSLSVVP